MTRTRATLALPDGKTQIWNDFKGSSKEFIRRNGREMRYLLLCNPKIAAARDLSIKILTDKKDNSLQVILSSRDCYLSCEEECANCKKLSIQLAKQAFQNTL